MHDYRILKENYGNPVSQTIDSPIMIFDFWELGDAFVALGILLVFGVIFYSWALMFFLLSLVLIVGPAVRAKHNKGIFFHWPYRKFGVSLPGLMNPKSKRKFSD